MPISGKPKLKPVTSTKAISAVIEKGGSVPTEKNNKRETEQTVNNRLPEDISQEIDNSISSQRVRISRHIWLMEAIVEKLDIESVSEINKQ